MNEQLLQLDAKEKDIRIQIQHNENTLCSILEANNELEAEILSMKYQQIFKDRPINVKNIFAEVQTQLFESDMMMKEDFLLSSIHQFDQEAERMKSCVEQLTIQVEQQRQQLLSIIREIDSTQTKLTYPPTIERPEETCSEQVEKLARTIAYSIDDVNEDELIQYLARGKSVQSEQQILERTRVLCEKKYNLRQYKVSKKILKEIDERLNNLIEYENTNVDLDLNEKENLSNIFDESANYLSQISANELNEDDSTQNEQWEQLQKISEKINVVRTQLLESIKNEDSIPLPQEFSFPEREKAALEQTLWALQESNNQLLQYLHKLSAQGILDSKILSQEEARQIVARYNELKQKQHEINNLESSEM